MTSAAIACLILAVAAFASCCAAWYGRVSPSELEEPNQNNHGRFRTSLALSALLCVTFSGRDLRRVSVGVGLFAPLHQWAAAIRIRSDMGGVDFRDLCHRWRPVCTRRAEITHCRQFYGSRFSLDFGRSGERCRLTICRSIGVISRGC